MQPRRLLIFVAARACSWILVNLQSTRSAISFNVKLLFNWHATHHELVNGIISAKMKVFLLLFGEFCEIPVYTVLHLVEVPLNCTTPTWCINYSSEVCFICKCGDVTRLTARCQLRCSIILPPQQNRGEKYDKKLMGWGKETEITLITVMGKIDLTWGN